MPELLRPKITLHTYLYPRQMGKWLSSFPLINSNYLMVKISHWMYLSLFPLNVVWGGGACHMSPNFLSLSLLWGAGKMAWVIWLFGSFIVLFSPLRRTIIADMWIFFPSKLELLPWVTFIFCVIFLCARCSWWRQLETWPKGAIIFLLCNFGPSVLSCCYLLFFETLSAFVLLFNFIIGSHPFLTF